MLDALRGSLEAVEGEDVARRRFGMYLIIKQVNSVSGIICFDIRATSETSGSSRCPCRWPLIHKEYLDELLKVARKE